MANPAPRSNSDRGFGAARWQSVVETLSKIPKIALISIIGPVVLLVGGYLLWVNYGAMHLNKGLYGLHAENIILTPQPTWIHASVLSEVYQGSELSRLSVLDLQMSPAMYNAFRAHPWIRKVFRVHKLPGAHVRVDVEYREPLAMVYCELANAPDVKASDRTLTNAQPVPTLVSSQVKSGDQSIGFLPVDIDGVLLPTQDFQREQIPEYMLIYAQAAVPIGMIGAEYGDARIKEALLLCRLLKDVREKMGIERVYVYPDPTSQGPSRWTLELTTQSKKIRWGHPPGLEEPGEPGFPAKLRKLGEFLLNPSPKEISLQEIDLVVSAKSTLSSKLLQSP